MRKATMSLRDYFASQPISMDNYPGAAHHWQDLCVSLGFPADTPSMGEAAAKVCAAWESRVRYIRADAMLNERKRWDQ